ncbi:FAD-linked oxidoreductase-like protein [Syncephalis plumigaleata]|nr:FAD-linked oxidoreductase-like protein [Syncephalis plumigaleata]
MAEGASHDNQKWGPRLDANLALIRRTFEDRSTLSLLRSLLIYEVCAYPQLVTLASKVINLAENMPLLNLPVRFAVRETAFRQFCGGETVEETLPLLTRMHRQNISGILDLSIEADISEATRNMTEDAAAAARGESTTYWRNNREGQATRKAAPGTFFAVKCTALASDPEIFEQWSVALRNARREFDELTGRQNIEQQQQQQQEPQQQQQKEQQTKILNPPTSVRLMIDAEQSYLQPAIAYMARQVARKYNQRDDATPPQIYDTYQLYLRQGLKNLVEDMVMAERNGYHWAGKLVRGAYVSTEQRYAHKHNQTNAIWPSKPDTDRSYDIGAAMAIEQANQGSAHVVVATHNNRSVARAMKLMERLDQQRKANEAGQQSLRQRIHFAQLLGMGELIMTRILEQGYQSAKYVPYGPVQEVVPYLLRRAEENGAMFVTPNEIASTPEEMEVDIDAGMPGEDRNAIIHILRERLGWRRWFGLRQV